MWHFIGCIKENYGRRTPLTTDENWFKMHRILLHDCERYDFCRVCDYGKDLNAKRCTWGCIWTGRDEIEESGHLSLSLTGIRHITSAPCRLCHDHDITRIMRIHPPECLAVRLVDGLPRDFDQNELFGTEIWGDDSKVHVYEATHVTFYSSRGCGHYWNGLFRQPDDHHLNLDTISHRHRVTRLKMSRYYLSKVSVIYFVHKRAIDINEATYLHRKLADRQTQLTFWDTTEMLEYAREAHSPQYVGSLQQIAEKLPPRTASQLIRSVLRLELEYMATDNYRETSPEMLQNHIHAMASSVSPLSQAVALPIEEEVDPPQQQ